MHGERIAVLQIIKSLGRGGAEMLLAESLKKHDQEKFEFHYIYFLPWKDQLVKQLVNAGGKVTCISANNNVQLILKAREVARYARDKKIKLIHAHLPWAGLVARIVGKITGIPVVYTEHNKQERYHFATRVLNLATMNALTAVIAVSDDVEQSIRKHKPGINIPVKKILNGVNVDYFAPQVNIGSNIRQDLALSDHRIVVGTVAVFRFQKRLEVWLEIAKAIVAIKPEVYFIVVGDGPLKEQIMNKVQQLRLTEHIHFAGLQSEVRPYLAAMDIYMMTSIFEGLPIALLEAMASGVPVITTNAGGIKEIIRHNVDGLICSVDDPYKLVEYATDLIENATRRSELAINGRKRIAAEFSMQTMVKELESVYNAIKI